MVFKTSGGAARVLALCFALGFLAAAGFSQSDEEKWIRDRAKTLAKDRDAKERAAAARWLGGRKSPEAVVALAKALSDPEASVREAAASALWDTGEAAAAAKPELTKTLGDSDPAVVARAAGALAAMDVSQSELAAAWRRALDGARDDATAFLAARGLIGIDPPEKLAPPILTFLSKRAEAAAKSGRYKDEDSKSAENAEKALARLLSKDPAPLLPLLDQTIARSPNSGRYVLGALASMKTVPPGAVDLALTHMRSPVAETRYAAVKLAGKMTGERQSARWIPAAIRLLADSDESVRMEACWSLKGVRGLAHEAAPELTRLLTSDPSMRVRPRAAESLEEVGDATNPVPKAAKAAVAATAKDALASAMKDKDHDLAVAAAAAYNVLQLDSAEIVAKLADAAVSGADVPARLKALQYLRNRQGQAKGIVETIRPLTRSPEKLVADDAKTAIEWIERGGTGSPAPVRAGGGGSAAPAAPPPASSSERELGGMAVLRERKLEFNEHGFNRALAKADPEAVRAYLDGGMSAKHVFADENGRTPLMILLFSTEACPARPEETRATAKALLEHGADVNATDEKKNTALIFAANHCDRQTLRILLKAGARLNARNWANLTALELSIVTGNPGLEELIDAGARLDPAKAKSFAEAYKNNPRALALIRKAAAK